MIDALLIIPGLIIIFVAVHRLWKSFKATRIDEAIAKDFERRILKIYCGNCGSTVPHQMCEFRDIVQERPAVNRASSEH